MVYYKYKIYINTKFKNFYERHNVCCVKDEKMETKVIKFTSLALAVFTLALTLYTIWIGCRLCYCSSNIIAAQEDYSIEYANSVYNEMNDVRRKIASENEFSNMVCHMNNVMRLVLIGFEGAVIAISYVLFGFMRECERRIALRERYLAAKRCQMSRR